MSQMLGSRPGATNGALGQIDTTPLQVIGTRIMGVDDFGNTAEFIYLYGCASTIVGSVVTYDEAGATALIAANAVGPVAVAMAINTSTTAATWYCICGTVLTDVVANCADNAKLGRETTDGKVGDGFASGDAIYGGVSRNSTSAAAVIYCQWTYPSVNDSSA